ncbi:helix-turn-helix domain-containing protein [Caviibacter abscessus]|uniref:helix-turn-helix domain-containing protein n=1 Tax=Caviibacter abscessus TaxID=1766719 RepID=UPI000837C92C|nr:helix-turn-helix transcriptional regulator [Caviibacter abscessus]
MQYQKLKDKISQKGLKHNFLAGILGISNNTFSRKIQGKSQFSLKELKLLSNELNLSTKEKEEFFL